MKKNKKKIRLMFTYSYTVFGGLYSVACTDAMQLACIILGLAVATPYAVLNPAVSLEKHIMRNDDWLGEIKNSDLAEWLDTMLLLIFGGIPWQVFKRRQNDFYLHNIRVFEEVRLHLVVTTQFQKLDLILSI